MIDFWLINLQKACHNLNRLTIRYNITKALSKNGQLRTDVRHRSDRIYRQGAVRTLSLPTL